MIFILFSHFISDVVLSSDGHFALSGTRQTLRLWDLSSQYVETIIAKCIDSYTARRAEEGVTDWLEDIVIKMFER